MITEENPKKFSLNLEILLNSRDVDETRFVHANFNV